MKVAAFTSIIMAGCQAGERQAGEDEHSGWRGVERDSAGVRVVTNPSTGTWTEATRWTVEPVLEIGALEGPPEYQFGRIGDVDADRDGRIHILDRQAGQVRVFDADGGYLLSYGGPGEGPGELSETGPLGGLAILPTPEGDVVVPDRGNTRVQRFDRAGAVVASFPLRLEEGEPIAWAIPQNGELVVHRVARGSPSWNGLLRIGRDGAVLDTILAFELQPSPWGVPVPDARGRRKALAHSPLWAILPDGRTVSGRSDRYRIEVRDPAGRLEMIVRREGAVGTLSGRERERYIDRLLEIWAEMFRSRGDPEERIQAQLSQGRDVYAPPERFPAFTGFAGGPDGTIWVRGVLPIDSMTAHVLERRPPLREFWSASWEVLSRDGRLLGTLTMPPGFTVHAIRGSLIYGARHDEQGVPQAVVLRIGVP